MNSWLLLSLVLAHIIGDFYFQSDKCCEQKEKKKIRSSFLYLHSFIIGVISWLLVPFCEFWFYALVIAISHIIIDVVKACFNNKLWVFIIDQLAHLGVLAVVATLFNVCGKLPIQMIDSFYSFLLPMLILVVLICLKPANILIKLILENYKIELSDSNDNIKNAGALIGNLERILTIIFVIIGQYEAIGFIIAAKSLLRFKETATAKTEYVLAGTFLSFGIAIVCGLLVKMAIQVI